MKNNNIDNINKMNSIAQQILELRQKLKFSLSQKIINKK